MNMQIIIAIVCLGLLIWVEPASAQRSKTHSLTVGRHENVALRAEEVDKILAEASKVLRKCNVILKRKGSVRPFASSETPEVIETDAHRDAVHSEDFDIKIVKTIGFCRVEGGHAGCAWDPPLSGPHSLPQRRSIIVKLQKDAKDSGRLWAHEFGHRTGLWHRGTKTALMTPCPLESRHVQITRKECECFLGGPGFCKDPEPTRPAQCDR
jgi:hypothetical protein